ncbi:MAG: HEAT repeat domain-containing protein [Planctomycetota bacterium]|nr:MAG: HEAT repeat domain-containing protein [Planctomycetota bacterium]
MTLTAGALIGLLALVQDAKDLQPVILKFTQDYYKSGADLDDKISAVNYLGQYRHEKVVRVLSPLLCEATIPVRIMVARSFSRFCNIELASKELLNGLHAQANSGKKQMSVRIEILRALGDLKYKPAAASIARFVEDKEVWVAKAAIDASGKVKFAEAIAPLIKALQRIEGKEGDAEISVDPLDGVLEGVDAGSLFKRDPREPKRPSVREMLRDPILGSLRKLTGQSYTAAKDWDTWWQKNRSGFKRPD